MEVDLVVMIGVYVLGYFVTGRLLWEFELRDARRRDERPDGSGLAVVAIVWPVIAAVTAFVAVFGFLSWLITLGRHAR